MDLEAVVLNPTWVNNRVGYEVVAKRIDKLLFHSNIIAGVSKIKIWVKPQRLSHHFHIYLEVDESYEKSRSPFKYNRALGLDDGFIKLIKEEWQIYNPSRNINATT